MHQLHLSDQLYHQAKRRAIQAGFTTVDEYVADMLENDLKDAEGFDHLFTPERLALIDRGVEQIDAGLGYTMEEVRSHLATARADWIQKNGQ